MGGGGGRRQEEAGGVHVGGVEVTLQSAIMWPTQCWLVSLIRSV